MRRLAKAVAPYCYTDDELRSFARFIAGEMRFDGEAAHNRGVTWYQAQVGADRCSLFDAATLRLFTLYVCREVEAKAPVPQQTFRSLAGRSLIYRGIFGRESGTEEHRTRRAAFLSKLPNRVQLGIVQHPERGRRYFNTFDLALFTVAVVIGAWVVLR